MSTRWRGNLGWVAGTAALTVVLAGCARQEPGPAKAVWNTSLDAAFADARAHHRPILLDFYAVW
jgi:thiol:disulfide interchange protein